jgi:raffinose/stachyose/melibiose transport system substrate-binding protein
MQKRRTRLLGIVLAAVVIVVAAVSAASATTKHQATVTLNLLYRGTGGTSTTYWNWLVSTFEKQHPNIHINVNSIPDSDYHQKIVLVLRGSSAPDVFFSWEGGWAQTMVQNKFAAPLDSYYKQYGWSKEMIPAGTKLATFGGHQWFVPYSMDASAIWYDTQLFKQYGLKPAKTWPQLVHIADVLKSHGIAPFLLANQQQWEAQFDWTGYFVNKYGEPTYQKLLTRKIPWTDPRVVATFQQLKTMADTGWFLNGFNSVDLSTVGLTPWIRKQVGMMYQGSFVIPLFETKGKPTFPINWFPYPQIGSTKPSIEMFAENTMMINRQSQHKAEAAELLNFLISKQSQNEMISTTGPFPVNKSVKLNHLPSYAQRLAKEMAKYHGYTWMHIDHALGQGVATPFLQELQGVLAGSITPQKAAQTTEAAARRVMGPVKS